MTEDPTEALNDLADRVADEFEEDTYWQGSQQSTRRWLRRFRHYYNRHRPNQAVDGRTPAREVLN